MFEPILTIDMSSRSGTEGCYIFDTDILKNINWLLIFDF